MRRGLRIFLVSVAVLLLAAAVAVVAAFAYHNGQWVVIHVPVAGSTFDTLVSWIDYEGHVGGMLVGSFGAGAVTVVLLLLIPISLRRGFDRRRQERFIGALEGELSDLRNLPLTQPAPYEDIEEDGAGQGEAGAKRRSRGSLIEDDDEALLIAALQRDSQRPAVATAGAERGKR